MIAVHLEIILAFFLIFVIFADWRLACLILNGVPMWRTRDGGGKGTRNADLDVHNPRPCKRKRDALGGGWNV